MGDEIVQGQLADDNSCDDVLRTTVFDTIQNETSTIKWPYPYDSVGTMRNKTTEEWDGRSSSGGDEELRLLMDETDFLERYDNCRRISDISVIPVLSGEGVGGEGFGHGCQGVRVLWEYGKGMGLGGGMVGGGMVSMGCDSRRLVRNTGARRPRERAGEWKEG